MLRARRDREMAGLHGSSVRASVATEVHMASLQMSRHESFRRGDCIDACGTATICTNAIDMGREWRARLATDLREGPRRGRLLSYLRMAEVSAELSDRSRPVAFAPSPPFAPPWRFRPLADVAVELAEPTRVWTEVLPSDKSRDVSPLSRIFGAGLISVREDADGGREPAAPAESPSDRSRSVELAAFRLVAASRRLPWRAAEVDEPGAAEPADVAELARSVWAWTGKAPKPRNAVAASAPRNLLLMIFRLKEDVSMPTCRPSWRLAIA